MRREWRIWRGWTTLGVILMALVMGSATLTAEEKTGSWSVTEFGAVADGTTDVTAAIQNALNTAGEAGGGVVTLPAGKFCVRGNLSIPRGVTLEGTYRAALTVENRDQAPDGTTLLAYAGRGKPEEAPFIRLAGTNSVVKGIAVIYPEWKREDVPPVPYPPCIESTDTNNVAILDCCLLNPYEGIKLVGAARHLVRNITGYPVWRGLFIDECYDIGRVENIHYWPFGLIYDPKDPYCEWINVNSVAFELARTDWHYVANTFCFGYGVGYKFSDCGNGGTNGNFLGLGADSCRRAVLVEAAQPPGLLITNGEFVGRWRGEDSVCVEITETMKGKVSLTNCSFWGPIDTCVLMKAPEGQFTTNACHFCDWDNMKRGNPAISLLAGKSIISSSTFMDEGMNVYVGKEARHVILTANQGREGFRYQSDSAKVVVSANEESSVPFDEESLAHYSLRLGSPNDFSFFLNLDFKESNPDKTTFRWGRSESSLLLPVKPGTPYDVELTVDVPQQAVREKPEECGFYLEDAPPILFKGTGRQTLHAQIPPQKGDTAQLTLRCCDWVPEWYAKDSKDKRTLGIQYYQVRMRAEGAGERVYDANTGEWKD